MRDDTTFYKVLFGLWLAFTACSATMFVIGCVNQSVDLDDLIIALCGTVVCQLYWKLWHETAPMSVLNIYIQGDRGDSER